MFLKIWIFQHVPWNSHRLFKNINNGILLPLFLMVVIEYIFNFGPWCTDFSRLVSASKEALLFPFALQQTRKIIATKGVNMVEQWTHLYLYQRLSDYNVCFFVIHSADFFKCWFINDEIRLSLQKKGQN